MKTLTFILAFGASLPVFAQTFSVDWHKIAGGGGTSSGGAYSVTGTIGQHDAGNSSGGNYTLEGGFISGIGLVQTPGAPELSVQYQDGNATVSWPLSGSSGFAVQESVTVANPASWNPASVSIVTNGNRLQFTVPVGGVKFFRLRKP